MVLKKRPVSDPIIPTLIMMKTCWQAGGDQGGDYDLVIADDYIIELAIQEGLVQKLDTSRISSYDNLNPVFMSQFYDPQNEYTVPYGAGIPLIVYDPD